MADDFANAYGAPTPRRAAHADEPTPPGPWAALPFPVPAAVRTLNDLAVTHLVIRPLERVDKRLAEARERVEALSALAHALLFRHP